MAFLNRLGSVLKQSVSKQIGSHIGAKIPASSPSIYQSLRCMSSSKLFVGGLPWAVDDSSLREAFSQYGEVLEARVIIDREQNRSRGFGFVTFSSTEEASSALQAMDGQELQGRAVRVNYAADRAPRSGGGYGGGGYGGGAGGYGGGAGGYGGGGGGYGGGGGGYGGGGYGGGNSGGYDRGSRGGYDGGSGGVAAGAGDSYFGGGAAGDNITADTGFGSSGFEGGSGLGADGGDFDSDAPGKNFGDDEPDDFVKRA